MVKLRSRRIRSPFGGDSTLQHNQQEQHQEEGNGIQEPRRSQRLQSSSTNQLLGASSVAAAAGGTTSAVERRPFESLESASESSSRSRSRSRSRSIRRVIASPGGGKRKPESRGITASIRRAKTAMFRMASSPMKASSSSTTTAASTSAAAAAMKKRNDGEHGSDRQGETTGGGAAALQRTPSQEENVPPLALLSPNVGVSYYAHAAAAAADNGECKAPEAADDSAMDVDTTSAAPTKNVLEWMRDDAPPELLPKLLSFCGSRKMNALSRVNKAWNGVMKDESVWRVVCEDTHKWKDGDEIPTSWAHLYKSSPCVPIDYDTIDAAFESISSGNRIRTRENHVVHTYREQRQSARILLHPGPYFLPRPIVANVVGTAEVAIELIQGVIDPQHGMTWRQNYHKPSSSSSSEEEMETSETDRELLLPGAYFNASTPRPSSPTLRQMFGCGRRSSSSAAAAEAFANSESSEHSNNEDCQSEHRAEFHRSCFDGPRPTALLCLESRNESEPIIRVRQGIVNLRGLKFVHYCEGTDIWNGNAAVQVQRAFGRNGRPLRVEPPSIIPTANLSDCDIMSLSGRGIVIIDGSTSHIHNCNVHTSAATGVYVGGAGSKALLTQTDVVDNGTGNTRNTSRNRGVARGHSGVYVEQGLAKMHDCNISGNTLTGISAVSTVQARLHIEESDIRANRSDQMELPSPESGRSVNRNNTIAQDGPGRPRSQHLRETVVVETPRQRSEPPTPQSPVEDTLLGA